MAIKGLIDTSAYVLGDYQDLGYYNPQRSVGKYIANDYAATDYFFDALELSSSFTISAEGTKDFIASTMLASFSVSAAAQKFDFASASITSSFGISVSPTRQRTGTSSTSASFNSTQQGNATFLSGTASSLTSSTSQNAVANFNAGVLNLPAVITQIQLAGELFFGQQIDITWESFKESEFIDRTWDEWYGDAWDQGGVLFVINTIAQAKGGYRAFGVASFSSSFTTQATSTRIRPGSATPSVVFTEAVNGNRIASGETSPTASFGIASDYIRIRGFTGSFTSVSSTTALGNAIFGPSPNPQAVFSSSTNALAVFDLGYGQTNTAAFTTASNGNADFKGGSSVTAFNTQLTAGRLITIADPFNTIKILQDTRTLVVPIENRTTEVLQQTRVNTITEQSRSIKVPQETRRNKIFRGVLTDRSSIPRVRSEL